MSALGTKPATTRAKVVVIGKFDGGEYVELEDVEAYEEPAERLAKWIEVSKIQTPVLTDIHLADRVTEITYQRRP